MRIVEQTRFLQKLGMKWKQVAKPANGQEYFNPALQAALKGKEVFSKDEMEKMGVPANLDRTRFIKAACGTFYSPLDLGHDVSNLAEDFPFVCSFVQKAAYLVREVYRVGQQDMALESCLNVIRQALEAAQSARCWVFDVHETQPGYDDFNGALLKCLLNGIARVGEETEDVLLRKLKFTVYPNFQPNPRKL